MLDNELFWPANPEEVVIPDEPGMDIPLNILSGLTYGSHAGLMVRLQDPADMGPVARAVYDAYLARRHDVCPCDQVTSIRKFIKAVRHDDDRRSASEREGEVAQ